MDDDAGDPDPEREPLAGDTGVVPAWRIDPSVLGRPVDRRLAVRITPDALRQVRAGHPWIYDRSITGVKGEGAPGDLAVVFDDRRRFAAIGLWDPTSPIRLKVLHQGRPATIDAEWFRGRIATADAARAPLWEREGWDRSRGPGGADPRRAGYRVVNGESDGLPGLIVDHYAGVAVVKVYTAAWFPHLVPVIDAVVATTGCHAVVLRTARSVPGTPDGEGPADAARPSGFPVDGDLLVGELADGPVVFEELGLRFEADVRRGQKTGHFLDQRANRAAVGRRSAGRRVLDVFASTGGFTVHAAAGGATSVHAVDLSAPTLEVARRNLAHNADRPAVAACRFTGEVGDAFEVLARLSREGRRFDVVVVDPPSFAPRASAIGRAESAYAALTRLALDVVEPGGLLVQASCSSRIRPERFFEIVTAAAVDHGVRISELLRTGHDVDHPVTIPETEYLKAGFWRMEGESRATGRGRRGSGSVGG